VRFANSLGQRLTGQLRGSECKIKGGGDARQQHYRANRQRTATLERRSDRQGVGKFRCIGCRNKSAGNLYPCRICFRRSDQPRRAVALDFIQLVTIDSKIAAGLRIRRLAKWPQDGENRRSCHQRENEPKGHGALIPRRPSTGGQHRREYITFDRDSNVLYRTGALQQKRALRAGRPAVAGDRNFRGLPQQRRIFPPEHLGAEPHGCIDLRLPETAIGITGMAQPL
jgi:hypothetical protein